MKFKEPILFEQFKGSTTDFIKEIGVGPSDYSVIMGKLKGGRVFEYLWWEASDKFHVNISSGSRNSLGKDSVWVNSNNIEKYITYLENLGLVKLKIIK